MMALAGCAQQEDASDPSANAAAHSSFGLQAEIVVNDRNRPADDRTDDDMRKPEGVLTFVEIEPGMTIFEMEAGAGYYTELFSSLVGDDGAVIMQSPPDFDGFLADAIEMRLANNRLPNVSLSKTKFDNLEAADSSVDIVTWFLGPHELYFTPNGSDGLGDPETSFAEIVRILKPGGRLIIVDHAAPAGSPETTGGFLHRIDPAIVKGLADDAGLVLVEESDLLRNPDDDFSMSVFDPAVRRMTDRFILKYAKP